MFSCLATSPKKKLLSKKQLLSPSIGGGGGGKISTRKLLARVLPPRPLPAVDAADDSDSSGGGRAGDGDLHSQLHALLKHIQRSGGDRLAKLAHAIETGASGATDCVRLDPVGLELQLGRHRVNARQLCLRAWRYPDLSAVEILTPFTDTCCSRRAGQCINPFHFYRTVSAAPDLHGLMNRLIQLEQKLPLISFSDNEVSSSGCSSDSLLSASRKSWLTTGSSGLSNHQHQRDGLFGGGGSGSSSCSSCCCCCCLTSDAQSSTAAASSLSGPNRLLSQQRALAPPLAETASESEAEQPVSAAEEDQQAWCAIAYWEGRCRIGHLVRVRDPAFRVCQRAVATDAAAAVLSLEALSAESSSSSSLLANQHRLTDPDGELARQAAKTRAKIGPGVALVRRRRHSRRHRVVGADDSDNDDFGEHEEATIAADEATGESTELIIFNQSEHAVFVHSPTLQPLSSGDITGLTAPYQAVKLPPGCCLKAFDSTAASLLCRARRLGQLNQCAPAAADPFTVRLSFVKGFGAAYQRQDIIYCPCWLEIMLSLG